MKWSRFFVIGLVVVIGVITAGVVLGLRAIPPLAEQIPDSPVSVLIVSPLNGEFFDSGNPILLQVQASSPNNVSQIEIWADGQRLGSQQSTEEFPAAALANFSWAAGAPGVHVLMARAVDSEGFTGQSSLAMITIKPSNSLVEFTASEGDTLAGITDFLGLDPEAVGGANPEMDPSVQLSEGTVVQLPQPSSPTSLPEDQPQGGGNAPEPGPAPNPIIYKISQIANLWNPPDPLPVPPLLYGTLENCNTVKLTVVPQSSNEDGYFVYRYVFNPQAPLAFENITVLGLGGAEMQPLQYSEPLPGLAAFYYVSAFNMSGEGSSAPISLTYDLDCLSGANQGPDQVELLGEFESGVPVSQAYCYYSTIPGQWQRFPSQPFDFFTPGEVQLEPVMLVNFPPNPLLEMECWGWEGSTLQYLGAGQALVSSDPVQLIGDNFSFDLPLFQVLNTEPEGAASDQAVALGGAFSVLNKQMPPPINLREAEDLYICDDHFTLLTAGDCQSLLNKQVKQEYIFIWDWETKTCWPGTDCPWLTDENGMGFNLYMVGKPEPVTTIYDPGVVIPLPWGYACFYVTAFTHTVYGVVESAPSNQFCPDQTNPPLELVLTPTDYLTLGKQSLYQCMLPPTNPALSLPSDRVMVGVIDTACWDFRFQGAVLFDLTQLNTIVGGYALQSATLRFSKGTSYYQNDSPDYEVASNEKPVCGLDFGWITGYGEWTSYDPTSAAMGSYPLLDFISGTQEALPMFNVGPFEVNVTYMVQQYGGGPNGGFGFNTNLNRLYDLDILDQWKTNNVCWNQLQDFELVIRYYPLGQ